MLLLVRGTPHRRVVVALAVCRRKSGVLPAKNALGPEEIYFKRLLLHARPVGCGLACLMRRLPGNDPTRGHALRGAAVTARQAPRRSSPGTHRRLAIARLPTLLALAALCTCSDTRVIVSDAPLPSPGPPPYPAVNVPTYLINLDSRPDRLTEALATWGSNVQDTLVVRRVPALPHSDGPNDIQNGCTASHLQILREVFLNQGYGGVILVLEDDARPTLTFADDFPRIAALAAATADEWDVIQLSPLHLLVGATTDLTFAAGFSAWPPGEGILVRTETVASTGALLYSPRIARALPALEAVVRGADRKTQPVAAIDNLLSSFRDLSLLVVAGIQPLLWQAPGVSDVSNSSYDGSPEHISIAADVARLSALLHVTTWVAGQPGTHFGLEPPASATITVQRPHVVACSTFSSFTVGLQVTYACTPGLMRQEGQSEGGEGARASAPLWRTSASRPGMLAYPPLPRTFIRPRFIANVDAMHPLWLSDAETRTPPPLPSPLADPASVVNVCLILGGPLAPPANPGLAASYLLFSSGKCARVVHVTTPRQAVAGASQASPGARLARPGVAGPYTPETLASPAVRGRDSAWGPSPEAAFWAAHATLPGLPPHCGHTLSTLASHGAVPRSPDDARWGSLHMLSVVPAARACVNVGLAAAEAWAAATLPPGVLANVTRLWLLPTPPLFEAPLGARNDALLLWEVALHTAVEVSIGSARSFLAPAHGNASAEAVVYAPGRRLGLAGQVITGGFGRPFELP